MCGIFLRGQFLRPSRRLQSPTSSKHARSFPPPTVVILKQAEQLQLETRQPTSNKKDSFNLLFARIYVRATVAHIHQPRQPTHVLEQDYAQLQNGSRSPAHHLARGTRGPPLVNHLRRGRLLRRLVPALPKHRPHLRIPGRQAQQAGLLGVCQGQRRPRSGRGPEVPHLGDAHVFVLQGGQAGCRQWPVHDSGR